MDYGIRYFPLDRKVLRADVMCHVSIYRPDEKRVKDHDAAKSEAVSTTFLCWPWAVVPPVCEEDSVPRGFGSCKMSLERLNYFRKD